MGEQKSGREFGGGTLLGEDDGFFEKPISRQVEEMGWSHACPVVDEVMAEYGPEWTLKRYAECNFVFGLIAEAARDLNPKLYEQLISPVPVLEGEGPSREFKSDLIPQDYDKIMRPLATPYGYAAPRVVIELMGRGKNNKDRTKERIQESLNLIDRIVKDSKSPIELLVKLSREVLKSKYNVDPEVVLSHVLSKSLLDERGCLTMFRDIKKEIDKRAPALKKLYDSMTPEEREDKDIINF